MGLAVFPVNQSKAPYTPHGCKDAKTDKGAIRNWWRVHPDANIGIATGSISGGIVVIDVDIDENKGIYGDDSLREWERENGELPETWRSITGRGGNHIFYRTDEKIKNTTNLISPPIVKPLLVLFSLDDAVPASYILAFVPIDSRIGEAGILVALEFEYGIIHQACIEYSKRAQKLKILYIKPRNLLEEPRLKLRNNILERALPAVGEIHKDGHPRGKFDKFLLNLPAH
jgi:hypothetical protein